MSLSNVAAIGQHIPEGAPLLAAAVIACAVDDLDSKNEHDRHSARLFLYGDHCARMLAGLGFDAAHIRAALDRTACNKYKPRSKRRTVDRLKDYAGR